MRKYVSKLDIHKSMGPDGLHPRMMRELANVTTNPFSITFEMLWQLRGKLPND